MSRAFIFKGKENELPVSKKISTDPFDGYYGDGIIEPPYNLNWLVRLPEHSNMLGQCIDAMETNIDGFGFTLEPAFNFGENNEAAESERKTIMHFFEFCNAELPYSQLRRRVRKDLEVLGNGYWEVIRDGKGDIVWLEHIEAHTMRLTQLDTEYTNVTYMIRDNNSDELQEYPSRKRFRRYVQIRDGKKVYFKEFGDPRLIDSRNGQVNNNAENPATEIIHFKLYCPYSPYGVPRWIGNWLSVEGSRQAEEVNYEYFENNTIPPMALLVAGTLDDKVVERIEDYINDGMKGRKSFNKILIIEASPFETTLPVTTSPKVSLQFVPLSDAQQKDSLFDNYDKTNREKIRSSFRLSPILVGLTNDYTWATAKESREVAEEQVFGPERADHDFIINRLLFPAMGVKYWTYKSLPPKVNDFEVMSGTLDTFSRCGLTVREVREEISRLLNHPLSEVNEKGDFVMSKIAADEKYGGNDLRKAIDYFAHLFRFPTFYNEIKRNDEEFHRTDYFTKMEWLKNINGDIVYCPDYGDLIRVAFMHKCHRAKLSELVSMLSGRDFVTKEYKEEVISDTYTKITAGMSDIINEYNFKQFILAINSAGFISKKLVNSQMALDFAYVLYLNLIESHEVAPATVKHLVQRWYVLSVLTGRYSNSPESAFAKDIRLIHEHGVVATLKDIEAATLSENFWNVAIVQNLKLTSTNNPTYLVYLAAQVMMNDVSLLSRSVSVQFLIEGGEIHHIFPKEYLKAYGHERSSYNQVGNYAHIDSGINKYIGKKAPNVYFSEAKNQCETKQITIGSIVDYDNLLKNLEANCIPEDVFDWIILVMQTSWRNVGY